MQLEIINYPFDELDDDRSGNSDYNTENVFIERPGTSDAAITYVNGHHIPDDDEDDVDEEDDLILGGGDELDEEDFDGEEIDVEVDDSIDEDLTEDDLVLDADSDEEDEEDV